MLLVVVAWFVGTIVDEALGSTVTYGLVGAAVAVWLLRKHGIVVVVGERDVGTSAVGSAVAQELIDRHEVDQLATHRFDLRGRSATTPDDALTIAARVASAWRIAPPTEETHARGGRA